MLAKSLYSMSQSTHVTFENDDYDVPRKNRLLLSAIISQAMNDGMTMVHLGIDQATSEAYMKYYGPADDENPRWWDMVPPPKSHYPCLFQYLISITSLENGMPLKGKVQFINRHQLLATDDRKQEIHVEIPDLCTIELSWPENMAKKRD